MKTKKSGLDNLTADQINIFASQKKPYLEKFRQNQM